MHLPLFIARRYLFAKKSHNVINIISAISAIGMAIGTAALVVILSVYNGFDSLVRASLSHVEPDLLVVPDSGKVFLPDEEVFDWARSHPAVATVDGVLQENVYLSYDGRTGIARAKGVDRAYEARNPLAGCLVDGAIALHKGDVPLALVGSGLAYRMGINPRFLPAIEVWFPARDRSFSAANPAASVNSVKVWPGGLFSVNTDIDNNLMVLPIGQMRELLGYTGEVSGMEVRLEEGTSARTLRKVQKELSARLGPGYKVLDRFRQNESLYKMMRYEKAAVYLILIFVLIIIAFNIFGSLSMLIIEKKEDIGTLRSLGAEDRFIRRVFVLEGWMISLLGMAVGLVAGIAIVLLQQKLGLVKMPGSFMVSSYPVILQPLDIIITATSVAVIGYLIALLPVRRSEIKAERQG
ncbi:MAG: ABC transporter permease [Bacteroidales bacterium]|nr:ABC transporter permease [Bacteroidales bacterium]